MLPLRQKADWFMPHRAFAPFGTFIPCARTATFGLLVSERVLTPQVTAWIVDADLEIMQGLLAAVAGIDDRAVLGSLVTAADQASVERDLRENHTDPAASSLGVPVDRYLLDAMPRLGVAGAGRSTCLAPDCGCSLGAACTSSGPPRLRTSSRCSWPTRSPVSRTTRTCWPTSS